MKNNLENSIKESLKEYELPYDSSAWTAMSKKLDQAMPTNPGSNMKWYLGGAATVAVLLTTIALWPASNTSSEKSIITAKNEEEQVSNEVSADKVVKNNSNQQSGLTNEISGIEELDSKINELVNQSTENKLSEIKKPINSNQEDVNINVKTQNLPGNDQKPTPTFNSNKIEFAASSICLGQSVEFTNKNGLTLIVKEPNGSKSTVTSSFKPKTEGQYSVEYLENETYISHSITVLPAPKVDFTVDDQNIFENGLPTVNVSTNAIGSVYNWTFENQTGTFNGKEESIHYFQKGNYTISLTLTSSNGCSAIDTKNVRIEEDYNLLAVNAFDPLSSDLRLNSFMPYALTQRNVDFKMIIIDPKDGAIIFETNDATNGWKGIDKRTGQMIDANKAYIWKVIINTPEKGEKSEYKSTIVRM